MSTDGKVTCGEKVVTVPDVLRFMTGSSAIPPGRFVSTDGKVTCGEKVVTVPDVLRFITGSSAIPPGGLCPQMAR